MVAILPFQFRELKRKFIFKTTKKSKLTTYKAMKLLLVVAAGSAKLVQR